MSGITNTQLMIEMKDMRTEFTAQIDTIGENVHQLDKKMDVHMSEHVQLEKNVDRNTKAVFGNNSGNKGIKSLVDASDEAKKIKDATVRKTWLDVRTALVVFTLTTAGQYLLNQIL